MSDKAKVRKLVTLSTVDVAQALQALLIPGKVITANISTGWIYVGRGNILRVQAGADMYVAFSEFDLTTTAVTVSTSPAVKVITGCHYIICQADFVRASANPTRIELLEI